jgi:hypothetical protein
MLHVHILIFVKMKITESNTSCVSPFIEKEESTCTQHMTEGSYAKSYKRKVPGEQIHGKKNGTLEAGGRTAPHTNEW